jgi:hypothetical protein
MLVDLMCEDQGHSPEQRLVLATIAKLEMRSGGLISSASVVAGWMMTNLGPAFKIEFVCGLGC